MPAKVGICINTYRRTASLTELLRSVAELNVPPEIDLVIVVVDNDSEESARTTVEAVQLPWPIVYDVEPIRNISHARNRAMRRALAERADLIAFIDDDETASPQWLSELLRVRAETSAEVVTGPVVGRPPADAPAWAQRGEFFTRRRPLGSGAIVSVAETANALVARSVAETFAFDPSFGLAGGGDSHFFVRARQAGARIVWAADAIVVETVPSSRATVRWLFRRAFREGNCGVFVERAVMPLHVWMPQRIAKTLARCAMGVGMLSLAVLGGKVAAIRALRQLGLGLGALAGLVGYRYVEYRSVHGA